MNEKAPVTQPRVYLSPAARHRRQMRWQIWAPLIASILIVLALVVLIVIGAFGNSPDIAHWANISAVWVIAPLLLVGFMILVITGASVFGMTKLLKHIPGWMLRIQLWMEQFSLSFRRASDAVTTPVMAVNSFQTRAAALWQRVRGKPARKPRTGRGTYS